MKFARSLLAAGALVAAAGCAGATSSPAPAPARAPAARAGTVVITVVGTSDLHGHVEALPYLSGYLSVLRRERAADGAVLALDAGDLFQGTLESNLGEGDAVVDAYNALGYAAAAVGNHEFDFGPLGPAATPRSPADDPQGALKARAREAHFPFLLANALDAATGNPIAWVNVHPSVMLEIAGVRVGVVGVTSGDTPRTTVGANVANLRITDPAEAVAREAASLRARGAGVVIAVAHAGGRCRRFENPDDLSSCDADGESFAIVHRVPPGSVDAIIAGHTHFATAQRVAGVPVLQSWALGRAFGRVDLTVDRAANRVVGARIFPPRELCGNQAGETVREDCHPAGYDGQPVARDEELARRLEPAFARARALREQPLGVRVESPVRRGYERESALGNLLAEALLAARPGADAAVLNAGGIRGDLDTGALTYGALFAVLPFDNKLATVRMTAGALGELVARSLRGSGGIVSLGGLRAVAGCEGGRLHVALVRSTGQPVPTDAVLTVLTSDFLALGGEGWFAHLDGVSDVAVDQELTLRDAVASVLRARGGAIRGDDPAWVTPRRLEYAGERPVRCEGGG